MLLEVKELRVRYDLVEAVKGISLFIEEGKVVALLGANGAGKTSIMKTILGLKAIYKGEIWFKSERIDSLPVQEIVKKGIRYVPEGRRIFPGMSVMDNLLMGAYTSRDRDRIKKDIEKLFGYFPILEDRKKQMGGTLSGGEQQMLATARALMGRPTLLLMDEPTLGLSPLFVKEVARIVGSINKDGVSVLLVEQNAKMALSISERGYLLRVGEIVIEGGSQDLKRDEYVQKSYLGG
jgi:branched-chain amino acid transport system ATP-binding protein